MAKIDIKSKKDYFFLLSDSKYNHKYKKQEDFYSLCLPKTKYRNFNKVKLSPWSKDGGKSLCLSFYSSYHKDLHSKLIRICEIDKKWDCFTGNLRLPNGCNTIDNFETDKILFTAYFDKTKKRLRITIFDRHGYPTEVEQVSFFTDLMDKRFK